MQGAGTGGVVNFDLVILCETGIALIKILFLFGAGLQFLGHRMGVRQWHPRHAQLDQSRLAFVKGDGIVAAQSVQVHRLVESVEIPAVAVAAIDTARA